MTDRIAGVRPCYGPGGVTGDASHGCYERRGMTKFLYAIRGSHLPINPQFASTLREPRAHGLRSLVSAGVDHERHIAKSHIRKEIGLGEVLKRPWG